MYNVYNLIQSNLIQGGIKWAGVQEEEIGEGMRRIKEVQEELMEKHKGLKENATDAKLDEFAGCLEKKYEDTKKDTDSEEVKSFFEKNLCNIYMRILKSAWYVVKQGREQEKMAATVRAMVTFQKLFFMEKVLIMIFILILIYVPLTIPVEQAKDEKIADTLKKWILELGFIELAKKLNMLVTKEEVKGKKRQSFARFQLRHMGGLIDLHAPSSSGFRF